MTSLVRAKPFVTQMRSGRLPTCSCRHQPVDGHQRQSGRNASLSGITPSTIMSPIRSHRGPWTEIRLGVRAHHNRTIHPTRAPPHTASQPPQPQPPLDPETPHR
jgi:hypothetical protein